MNVSLTPCSFSIFSLYFSRSALIADMSTSLNVVRWAVACCDWSRFSAIRFRRVDIFSRVSRSPGAAPFPPPRDGGGPSWRSRHPCRSLCSGATRSRAHGCWNRGLVELTEHVVDMHDIAFVFCALGQHTRFECRDFYGDFVCVELDQRITGGN